MKDKIEDSKNEIAALFKGSIISYLVGFYVFAFYLELHTRISALNSIRFQFIFGAFIGFICIFKLLSSNDQSKLGTATKLALLLIAILGFYSIFSFDVDNSITVYLDRVIKFSLISFFIYSAVEKVEDLRVIVAFMLLAWLKIGQEGVFGWITGGMVWENQGIPRLHGVTTMFAHPNSYSGFAVGCLPFALFLITYLKSHIIRIGLVALVISAIVIVINTGSRTGYVATLIWAIYFFSKLKMGKIKILLCLIIGFTLVAIYVPDHYKERFESIFTGEEKEGRSSEKRKEIISDAIQVYKAYPMGVGVNAFPVVREEMFGRTQDTHNLYLEVLTNIGPIGLIVFLSFIYFLIKQGNMNFEKLKSLKIPDIDRAFLMALSRAVVGFVLARMLLGLFGMDLYEVYWWLSLGYTLAISKLIYLAQKTSGPSTNSYL
jgi:putative inorganic carbon (HCO3(-)) transporter